MPMTETQASIDDILKDAQTFVNAALEIARMGPPRDTALVITLVKLHAEVQKVRNSFQPREEEENDGGN